MRTIQARVNTRLLNKASRLFTGTLEGRVIEILQNARRAGATEVHIINTDGIVTVQDNGRGIEDFSKLLDLGGSGWDDALEVSEDPAGVGIFCLAPREVTIGSNRRTATISEAEYPSCLTSPRHQREHAPSKVFTRVRGVAFWFQGQLGSNLLYEVVVGIRFEPSTHGEPLGRLVPIPAFLVSQDHFHNVVVEVAERRDKFWKHEKVGDRIGKASLGNVFRRW